jgi:hypothetical protein
MATIWRLATVSDLLPFVEAAGPVDEEVVQEHLAGLRADRLPAPR